MLVCLDAGHGKNTAGKRSPDSSLLEYEFNQAVTDRLIHHLTRHGIHVLLTCPTDDDVSLNQRCSLANTGQADIFISLHANAAGSTWNDACGWEIYAYGSGGEGEKLAKAIHTASIPYLGLKDRGIKFADFYVLKNTKMPAVLIEHGFYTNQAECSKLKSEDFRQQCAAADAKGILAYLGIAWQEENKEKEERHEVKKQIKIRLNGIEKSVTAIEKDGHNFVLLQDLRDSNISVDYDKLKNIPVINCK